MTLFRLIELSTVEAVVTDFDEESFLLTLRVAEPETPGLNGEGGFSEQLGTSLGVRRQDHILTVGDLVLVMAAGGELLSMEWRLGPAVLRPGAVALPEGPPCGLRVDAAWDENGRADGPGVSSGVFDRASGRLSIELGSVPEAWGFVAEGVAVVLSREGALARVVLANCPVDLYALMGAADAKGAP